MSMQLEVKNRKKHYIACANKPCSWSYSPSWNAVAYSSGTFIYKMGTVQTVKLKSPANKCQ